MKKCLIEAPFTFDAGPPIIAIKYSFYKYYLGCDKFKDMDGALYKFLDYNLEAYNHLLYLSGGMTFSYPFTARVPFNIIPFEDLYSVELLIAIIFKEGYNDEIKKITEKMGLDYNICCECFEKLNEFFKQTANELKSYERVYVVCERPAAVFSSILTMHFLKLQNKECEGILIGKHATTPHVKQLIEKPDLFSEITNEDFLVKAELNEKNAYSHLAVEDFELDCYPETWGMRNISYSVCKVCPYRCNFCSISMNWNGKRIYRSSLAECKTVEQVKADLIMVKEVFGISFISFCDCTMNYAAQNPELFRVLKEINMLYACTSRADIVTADFCNGLRDSNFISVIIGVESLNPKTIELMGKGGGNYTETAVKNCKKLYDVGLDIQLNSLICYPYERYEDVKNAISCWKYFTESMRKNGVIVQKIPVGTLTLNYPSKMYFDVINDDRFEKKFHKITDRTIPKDIRNIVEKIPDYAIDMQKEKYKEINKMELVKQIYGLWDRDMNLLNSNLFGRLIQNIDVLVEAWISKNKMFEIICEDIDEKLYSNQNMAKLIDIIQCKTTNFSEISNQMLVEKEIDIQNTAQMILLLSFIGVLKIR